MLIHVLGPQDEMEANGILRAIKMAKDPVFSKLSTSTGYVRDWKDSLRWCRAHVPRSKVLVKNFLSNVHPRKLATALENAVWMCPSTHRMSSPRLSLRKQLTVFRELLLAHSTLSLTVPRPSLLLLTVDLSGAAEDSERVLRMTALNSTGPWSKSLRNHYS